MRNINKELHAIMSASPQQKVQITLENIIEKDGSIQLEHMISNVDGNIHTLVLQSIGYMLLNGYDIAYSGADSWPHLVKGDGTGRRV